MSARVLDLYARKWAGPAAGVGREGELEAVYSASYAASNAPSLAYITT